MFKKSLFGITLFAIVLIIGALALLVGLRNTPGGNHDPIVIDHPSTSSPSPTTSATADPTEEPSEEPAQEQTSEPAQEAPTEAPAPVEAPAAVAPAPAEVAPAPAEVAPAPVEVPVAPLAPAQVINSYPVTDDDADDISNSGDDAGDD